MQGNKIRDLALLKTQAKIWEQKRHIRDLEAEIDIKKAIQNYD